MLESYQCHPSCHDFFQPVQSRFDTHAVPFKQCNKNIKFPRKNLNPCVDSSFMYIEFFMMYVEIYNMTFDTGIHTLLFIVPYILINWHILKISIYLISLMLHYLMLNVCSILANDTITVIEIQTDLNICNGAESIMFKELLSMLL